ncbi:MAG: hypothetical protein J0H68_00540 [Sphingobacteriia bacterium]|nr:hypothetical protein [Sphingobacteriia bacterium]
MDKNKNNGQNNNIDFEDDIDQPEVEHGLSKVASVPAKNIAIIVIFSVLMGIMVYNFFFSSPKEEQKKDLPNVTENLKPIRPAEDVANPLPQAPSLPEPPKIEAPQAPELPPIQPQVVELPSLPPQPIVQAIPLVPEIPEAPTRRIDRSQLDQRRKSAIMIAGGEGSKEEKQQSEKERLGKQVISSNFRPERTSTEQVQATKIGDLTSVVAQGKIIDAILETAITTDLQGYIRAIISRDVYAESGKGVMIPKGSRLVGTYAADIKRGQNRVLIAWNRIIRPDGIDIQVDSPGVDQIGRAGVSGVVDNKYFEILTNAVLLSAVTFGITYQGEIFRAQAEQKLQNQLSPAELARFNNNQGSNTTTQTVTQGNVSVTTQQQQKTPVQKAFEDGMQNINDAAKKMVQDSLDERPTITVDQGTRIKVFVRKDLLFPAQYNKGAKIIH